MSSKASDVPIVVRTGEQRDINACARLARRDGAGPEGEWASTFRRTIADQGTSRVMFVAELDETIVGYARAVRIAEPVDEDKRMPVGWYLLGVLVDPPFRRRGIGHRLTSARVAWLRSRTHEVYYFTERTNEASQRLHAAVGFEQLPGVLRFKATNGSGAVVSQLIFRLNPASHPPEARGKHDDQIDLAAWP